VSLKFRIWIVPEHSTPEAFINICPQLSNTPKWVDRKV